MTAYMYKEGTKYYVVYGDTESFFGPEEKAFNSKKEANKFLEEKKLNMVFNYKPTNQTFIV